MAVPDFQSMMRPQSGVITTDLVAHNVNVTLARS